MLRPKAPTKCGPRLTDSAKECTKAHNSFSFRTLFTYCIEVSLFHDNALTPKCEVDLFWTSVIMVLNAGAEPRGCCVQSIRLEHSRASHE